MQREEEDERKKEMRVREEEGNRERVSMGVLMGCVDK